MESVARNGYRRWPPWNHRSTRENYLRPVHTRSSNTHALPPSLPNSWFDRVFSSSMASHPANFAGTTPVSRRPSLHTSRVSAGRKRNEKVERANPGNRVTHRQKSRRERERGRGSWYRHCDVSNAIGQPIFEEDKKNRDS